MGATPLRIGALVLLNVHFVEGSGVVPSRASFWFYRATRFRNKTAIATRPVPINRRGAASGTFVVGRSAPGEQPGFSLPKPAVEQSEANCADRTAGCVPVTLKARASRITIANAIMTDASNQTHTIRRRNNEMSASSFTSVPPGSLASAKCDKSAIG
jgi:hypothetical protein